MAETWKRWEGQVVNDEFELRRYLGGSDHSAVFLTERGGPDPQRAAIKLIPVNAADPELQLSWWELSAKLTHPHLLRLAQRGRCQIDDTEMLYAVSEYAEENLAQILPHRCLTSAETLDMLQAVVDALSYVHGKGFVHGHIKPSNIMAVGDQVKLSSDGLCGTGESSRVLGAPGIYAAPEIAGGGGILPASDVWSLGMTLVEALTQHPPVLQGTERDEPVVPTALPAPFLEIARNCLHWNPRQRWTVEQIAARLHAVPPEVREVKPIEPPKARSKSTGIVTAAVAGLLLLAVVVGPKIWKHQPSVEPVSSTVTDSSNAQVQPKATGDSSTNQPSKPAASTPTHSKSKSAAPVDSSGQGSVAGQVIPDVPRSASNTIHGKIKVSVKVNADQTGNVTAARFVSHGSSKYFAKQAMTAAQRWTFKPPQVGGQPVASEWIVYFEFARSGATARATKTAP